jgi:2-alkenal reductase
MQVPETHRETRLAAYPVGKARVDDFATVEVALPRPGPGEVLVRNTAFLVSPSIRSLLGENATAEPGVPFPPVRVGEPLGAGAVGEVVAAPSDSALKPGDRVLHVCGWREYAAVPLSDCHVLEHPSPDPMVHLGHGWTAYAAVTRGAAVRAGDTVFVSSAAGAIGSMAGQIARLLGASRVVGSTSTPQKAARIVAELGYDAVVTRSGPPVLEQLRAAAPDGIDVVIDCVGGSQLQAALSLVRDGARVALLGTLAHDLADDRGGRAPVTFDGGRFLERRVTMRGYSADDDLAAYPEWKRRSAEWQVGGRLPFPRVEVEGLERAPQALIDATAGHHIGAVLVRL